VEVGSMASTNCRVVRFSPVARSPRKVQFGIGQRKAPDPPAIRPNCDL
jgi:hypothetical protein